MSRILIVHLVMEEPIDSVKGSYPIRTDEMYLEHLCSKAKYYRCFIDRTFNWHPHYLLNFISTTSNNNVIPYLQYHGPLLINGIESTKYCYNIENGQNMFARLKYAYYDSRNGRHLSRCGKSVIDRSLAREKDIKKASQKLKEWDNPPIQEIQSLFQYILSINACFYIFFEKLDVEAIIPNSRCYFEHAINQKEERTYKSKNAQMLLLDLFKPRNINWTTSTQGILYKTLFKIEPD